VQVRGTRSCPALAVYDPDQLDAQLDAATRAFCCERVRVELQNGRTVVTLPAIFEWYQEDFGAAEGDMLHWLAAYLPDPAVRINPRKQPHFHPFTPFNVLITKSRVG
jgi:hypothetical protein